MNKFLAYYLRLSDDDIEIEKNESQSISNQRSIILDYIKKNKDLSEFSIKEYCDDGYSGVNFKRPSIQELLKDVQNGKIDIIIVKDFSRFGRSYIEVGDYINQIFPFLGIRFISVTDQYDSSKNNLDEIEIGFKTLVHDLYSKDLSRKVKSSRKLYQEKGYHCGGGVPFGYIQNKNNKSEYLIDETAATIVKLIFELAADKMTTGKIAGYLNEKKIDTPGKYRKKQNQVNYQLKNKKQNLWTATQVKKIIEDEVYIGTYICHKKYTDHMKLKNAAPEEYLKFEQAHQPIVSQELFTKAQTSICKRAARGKYILKEENLFPLKGKVKCGYCGYSMNKVSRVKQPYFVCRMGDSCPSAFNPRILLKQLENILLKSLKNYICLYNMQLENNNKNMKYKLLNNLRVETEKKIVIMKIEQLQTEKLKNYENYKQKNISKELFIEKQTELTVSLENYNMKLETVKNRLDNMEQFQEDNTKTYIANIEELTRDIAEEFVEKIEVYNTDKIQIIWKFNQDFLNY